MDDTEAADKARKFIETTGLAQDGAEFLNGLDDTERDMVFNAVEVLWCVLQQQDFDQDAADTLDDLTMHLRKTFTD